MDINEITSRVKDTVVKKLGVEESQVTLDASFTKDLGADSLDTVELIMEFEREFDIAIEDADQSKVQTVGQVVEFLDTKLNA